MEIQITDYNSANVIISKKFTTEWNEIENILKSMPLQLKGSDQKGKKGQAIFSPVATNNTLKVGLSQFLWCTKIPIPSEYSSLGTDVDFGKKNIVLEAQFSNYPFVINNIIRTEAFYKNKVELLKNFPVELLIIITKAHMFPSSNSSLYYEQAKNQFDIIKKIGVFAMPVRLVGLFSPINAKVKARWTKFSAKRYSRKMSSEKEISVNIKSKLVELQK